MSVSHTNHALQFKSLTFTGLKPGLRLIILGAVHGNETCGTQAIEKIMQEFECKQRTIVAGSVTFVPITNPLAYAKNQRMGDRNLNRNLNPSSDPKDFEDHVANWLCPLLAQHDVLLDLHSFHTPGQPFALLGPLDNTGELEPFAYADEEESLALRLGVNLFVDGWLDTYSRGVAHRMTNKAAYRSDGNLQNLDVKYGVGTTEYMRAKGGWGITLECGQHEDVNAPKVAYQAISNTLAHLGLIDCPAPTSVSEYKNLRIVEVIDRIDAEDQFNQDWKSFDTLKAGDLIGTRKNGMPIVAEQDAVILFPNPKADAGNEWFYLAKMVTRF
jgi:predicted deacylase